MQSLIKPKSTRYLTGLIPITFTETIFEYENFFYIYVSGGETATEEEWNHYKELFSNEFNENLVSMYQCPQDNLAFEVYLKKSK